MKTSEVFHIADDERINGGDTTSVFESDAKQEAHGQHYSPIRLADHGKKTSLNNILMHKICMFVARNMDNLIRFCFTSHGKIFAPDGDVTIAGAAATFRPLCGVYGF